MKKAIFFGVLFLPIALLLYCSITNDSSKIEGNWWQNNLAGPNGTYSADSKDSSSNQVSYNPDRTYVSINPFTGEQQTGVWTLDTKMRIITVYLNPVAGSSNSNNLIISNKYDMPDGMTLKLFNPSNFSYFTLLKRD